MLFKRIKGRNVLSAARNNEFLDLGDRFGWVESFGTGSSTVHDRMTTVKLERIFELIETIPG